MSNDFVSQQLAAQSQQMDQMEPISILTPSISEMQMAQMVSMPNNPSYQQFSPLDVHMSLVATPSNSVGSHFLLNRQLGQLVPRSSVTGSNQFLPSVIDATVTNTGLAQLSAANKRKEPLQSVSNNPVSHHASMPNKRIAQMRPTTSTPAHPVSASNKKTSQMSSTPRAPGSLPFPVANRKMGQTDSPTVKAGAERVIKALGSQMESKSRTESFDSVRSKLRESLIASLEMVSHDNSPNVGKDTQSEQDKVIVGEGSKSEVGTVPGEVKESQQPPGSIPRPPVTADHTPEKSTQRTPTSEGIVEWKQSGQDSQSTPVFPGDEVCFSDSLFVKDELLLGNGLSWAMDVDIEVMGHKEGLVAHGQNMLQREMIEDKVEKPVESPKSLAFQIEAELFKLFGGVNKKYKEKGRSLLFNLKDRNNPELREKVMSGDISPKRLCSMTAEELASKELSEWRIAKAEELAQMVVLPDSDVDVRRLVKKTHKGEVQVEVEQDDNLLEEVSVGASSLTHMRPKGNRKEAPSSTTGGTKDAISTAGAKGNEGKNPSAGVTVLPQEGVDPMQGIEVDELKDTEFLPPIVSLDEFMESLDSEPPFENLSQEAGKTTHVPGKGISDVDPEVKSSQAPSSIDNTTPDKPEDKDVVPVDSDPISKSISSNMQSNSSPPAGASKGENVWDGLLQLSVSAVASVTGFLKSGEKTSTKEWPNLLEIKGRVRLDAFEKFIQDLPNSRSRAIMVVHFLLKDQSHENEQAAMSEVVESYVTDERLGFGEPAPGVEIYFCPAHARTLDLLKKHLPKEYSQSLSNFDSGLIGIVVWRRVLPTSTISPKSNNKHSSKRQQLTSRKPQENSKLSPNLSSRPPSHAVQARSGFNPPADDDEDDVPPGFGPGRDEDDLPEFNFSGGSNTVSQLKRQSLPHVSGRAAPRMDPQAQQMRELIQKYGQSGGGAASGHQAVNRSLVTGIQRWEDDDDDIPEWQPQGSKVLGLSSAPTLPQAPIHSFLQQQRAQPHMLSQPQLGAQNPLHQPLVPLQSSVNLLQSTWGAPPGHPLQGNGLHPTDWRQVTPRSRGF